MQKNCRHTGIIDSGFALRAPRNDEHAKSFSRRVFQRPSLAHHTHDPEKWSSGFRKRSLRKDQRRFFASPRVIPKIMRKKREAERREAHCSVNVRAKRGALLPLREKRRLSALTLAALATGYHPDGSAPEPGFPRRWLTGVLPASLKDAAVKHAPCRPVLMPVDRGPESRPSADWQFRPRGPRLALVLRHAFRKAPSTQRDGARYRHRSGEVKAFAFAPVDRGFSRGALFLRSAHRA